MKIAICDDDRNVLTFLENTFHAILSNEHLEGSIHMFSSGEDLLFYLDDNPNIFDIIFLDIDMKTSNGIEIAKMLRNQTCHAEIIFLTNEDQYVFQSFDVQPFQYLLKSEMDEITYCEILKQVIHHKFIKNHDYFTCKKGDIKKTIPLHEILYFEAHNRSITIYYQGGSFSFYSTMQDVLNQLDQNCFVRIHRAYIVQLSHVEHIISKNIELSNGEMIVIGNTYLKPFKDAFANYILTCV